MPEGVSCQRGPYGMQFVCNFSQHSGLAPQTPLDKIHRTYNYIRNQLVHIHTTKQHQRLYLAAHRSAAPVPLNQIRVVCAVRLCARRRGWPVAVGGLNPRFHCPRERHKRLQCVGIVRGGVALGDGRTKQTHKSEGDGARNRTSFATPPPPATLLSVRAQPQGHTRLHSRARPPRHIRRIALTASTLRLSFAEHSKYAMSCIFASVSPSPLNTTCTHSRSDINITSHHNNTTCTDSRIDNTTSHHMNTCVCACMYTRINISERLLWKNAQHATCTRPITPHTFPRVHTRSAARSTLFATSTLHTLAPACCGDATVNSPALTGTAGRCPPHAVIMKRAHTTTQQITSLSSHNFTPPLLAPRASVSSNSRRFRRTRAS